MSDMNDNFDAQITFPTWQDQKDDLQVLARGRGTKIAQIMREAAIAYLEKNREELEATRAKLAAKQGSENPTV